MSYKLIVGLGNYPKQYHDNRHNVGFMVIDKLCQELNLSLNQEKFDAKFTKVNAEKNTYILLQPQTYMNLSGESVSQIMSYFHIDIKDLLVIYDDIDLSLGEIRFRMSGSAGGHNGMKSIITKLKEQNFMRLRIGIDKPGRGVDLANYVTSDFSQKERMAINQAIKIVVNDVIKYMNGTQISHLFNDQY
jgi:PTH1 family peptidyl-tRNA hydrolase